LKVNSGIAKTIIRFKRAAAVVAVAAVSLFIVAAGNATSKTSGKGKNANPVAPKTKDRFIDQESKSDPAMRSFAIVKKNESFIQNPTNEKAVQLVKKLTGQALREKQALTASEIKRWEKNTATLKKNKMLARSRSKNYKKRAKRLSVEIKQASARGENTTRLKAEKAHLEHKAAQEGRGTKKATKNLKTENARHDAAMNGKPSAGQRALDHVGFAGIALSLVDAAKNAYYETTDEHGNKVVKFSFQKYLVNAFQNVTGIAAAKDLFTGTIDTGAKEYDRLMAEYKKKGITPTNGEWAEILAKSFLRAAAFGAYNGAKCVPVLGDLLNGLELGAAAGEWYHDTKESERIQAENAVELERQRKMGMVKIKALMKDYKACGTRVENIQKRSEEILADFKTQHRQYIEVFTRMVKRGEAAEKGDALAEAAKKAKPFLVPKYLEKLASDVKVVGHAADVTVKLADTTIDNIQNHGGSPESAAGTAAELKKMVETLKSYDQECAAAVDALSPLMGGGGTIDKQAEAAEAAATDSMVASDIYATAADLVAEHKALLAEERRLRETQKKIMDTARKLTTYYYIGGDETTKTDIEIALRNAMQYKIDDYPAKKLAEHQNTLNFGFRDFRGDIPVPEGLPPEVADAVALAADTLPGVAGIRGTLKAKIAAAEAALGRLAKIGKTSESASSKTSGTAKVKTTKYSDAQLAGLSLRDICGLGLAYLEKAFGYTKQYYKSGNDKMKILETGTVRMKNSKGLYEKKRYSIYFVKGWDSLEGHWPWYLQAKSLEKMVAGYVPPDAKRVRKVSIPNAQLGRLCYSNESLETLDICSGVGPFLARTNFRLGYEVGKSRDDAPYGGMENVRNESYPWKYMHPDDRRALMDRIERWRKKMPDEAKAYQNARLAIARQLPSYTDRHCYKKPYAFLDALNGSGFGKTKKEDHINSGQRNFDKCWNLPDGRSAHFTMSIRAGTWFPGNNNSWRAYKKNRINTYSKNFSRGKRIAVGGAYYAVSTLETKQKTIKFKNGQVMSITSVHGTVVCLKNNVAFNLYCSGEFPSDEKINPLAELAKVLATLTKSDIK
jgi:hypothetical protein